MKKLKKLIMVLSVIILISLTSSCANTPAVLDEAIYNNPSQAEMSASRDMKKSKGYVDYRDDYNQVPYNYNPYYNRLPSPDDAPDTETYQGRIYYFGGYFASWQEWSDYLLAHPNMTTYGSYYYKGINMRFRFCNPDNNKCFFFSIKN